jgi:hypothetical protein
MRVRAGDAKPGMAVDVMDILDFYDGGGIEYGPEARIMAASEWAEVLDVTELGRDPETGEPTVATLCTGQGNFAVPFTLEVGMIRTGVSA